MARSSALTRRPGRSRRARRRETRGLLRSGAQFTQHPLHFLFRVVVHKTDAEEAAVLLDAEALGEIESVVVSVPGEDAALAQFCCKLCGMPPFDANSKRRASRLHALGIADSVKAQAGNFGE